MKRKLAAIAKQLSDADLQELIRLKKTGDKKAVQLRKRRDKLALELERLDRELAAYGDEAPAAPEEEAAAPRRRGRKAKKSPGRKRAGRPAASAEADKPAKAAKRPGRRGGKNRLARGDFSAAVREVFARAGNPLKAKQVVDGLPEVGIAVKDVADMRKRISVVLASQKNHFEQVERGVYRLKD